MTSLSAVLTEIEELAHFSVIACKGCAAELRVHVLQIYAQCPQCGASNKCRAFGGIGTEIQDVVDAVLAWAGDGENFDAVMKRRREILEDGDDETDAPGDAP
jgi:predicted RNA-binding Zn-ribbon protein involved in translation (DUF1610 family)